MSESEFDNDRPPERPKRSQRSDDPPRLRRRPTASADPKKTDGAQTPTDPGGLPRWALPAVGAAAVLILFLVVLRACTGSGGGNDAGSCMSDLFDHLPASVDTVAGIDYVGASHNGFKRDGSLEELGQAMEETGVIPDPVTAIWRIKQLTNVERFEAQTGIRPDDIICSVGTEDLAALSGRFNAARVKGSDAGASGRLAATDSLVTLSTGAPQAAGLLESAGEDSLAADDDMLSVLESLRDQGAYSLIVQRGDGTKDNRRAIVAGIGAAGGEDERTVAIAWVFPDEDSANESRPEVAEILSKVLQGTISVRSSDLTVDGTLVTASIASRNAPDLQTIFDANERLVPQPD